MAAPSPLSSVRRWTAVTEPSLEAAELPGGLAGGDGLLSLAVARKSSAAPFDAGGPIVIGDATLGKWRRTVTQIEDLVRGLSPAAASDVSESEDEKWALGGCQGLFSLRARLGASGRHSCLIAAFAVLEMLKFLLASRTYHAGAIGQNVSTASSDVNMVSILVMTNLVSLTIALVLAFLDEGVLVFARLSDQRPLMRSAQVSMLFTAASVFVLLAYKMGAPAVEVVTVGYIYMPMSAILSHFVFRRRYGMLEWLAVGMMTLSILAFVLLREEAKESGGRGPRFSDPLGFGLVFGAVIISVWASILAEKLFKDRTPSLAPEGVSAESGVQSFQRNKFLIQKVRLDFSALLVSACIWCDPIQCSQMFDSLYQEWSHSEQWFGTWGSYQYFVVAVAVLQGWAAALVTKEFSTVTKAIVQTVSIVLITLLEDPLMGNRFHFQSRELPSVLLAVIAVMCAMIFQTGRLNLRVIRMAMKLGPEAHPSLNLGSLPLHENTCAMSPSVGVSPQDSLNASPRAPANEALKQLVAEERGEHNIASSLVRVDSDSEPQVYKSSSALATSFGLQWDAQNALKCVCIYSLLLIYICFDSGRTLVLQKALSTTAINSTSMGLVCYVCGVAVASILTAVRHGTEGLSRAWSVEHILHCLPCAFLFALATALGNLAFAHGITGSLYVVLGKVYTPVAALGTRWILGRYYMWLEWFALVILTFSSAAFGYLQADSSPASGAPVGTLLVLASATVSALGSLLSERILKSDDAPFIMQKVCLDFGSILSSLALIPIIGAIGTRPQDVPWASRPLSFAACDAASVCWSLHNDTCANPQCDCPCVTGVFAGWGLGLGVWVLVLAVIVNTVQGWLVGLVTQRFSVVHRAIADSFSLLAVYFVGDPLLSGTSLGNVSLNLVAFIVPLSTAAFTVGASEMHKVFQAESWLVFRRTRLESGGGATFREQD